MSCRRCTRRKLWHFKTFKIFPEKSQILSCDTVVQMNGITPTGTVMLAVAFKRTGNSLSFGNMIFNSPISVVLVAIF